MVDYTQKLTEEFINQARSSYEKTWGEAHSNWMDTDRYVGLEFDVWPTAILRNNRPSYRPSTARQKVKHAVDVLLAHDPIIHSNPSGPSEAARGRVDSVEEAISEIVLDSFMRSKILPTWQVNWYLLTYNYAVLEAPMLAQGNMAVRPLKPRRGKDEDDTTFTKRMNAWKAESKIWNPVEFRVPHPASVLMDPEQKEPPMAIKSTSMFAIDLHNLSVLKSKTRGQAEVFHFERGGEFELIELEDVWTAHYHMIKKKKGEPIYQERNTWGHMPYIHGFGGFGHIDSTNNLKKRTEGILDPIKDSLLRQAQNYSAKHHVLMRHAYSSILTTGSPEELAESMATGAILSVNDINEVGAANFPEVSRQLFESGREIDDDIDQAIPGILGGQRSPGVSTVGQHAIQSTSAQRAFAMTQRTTEYMFSTALQRLLKLVDTQDIQIMNLTKAKIQGNYSIFATFPQTDPAIMMARTDINMRKVSMNLMSRTTFWEEEGLANTTEEERRLLVDMVKQMPEIIELLAATAAQGEGLGDEFDQAVRARQGNQQPVVTNPNSRDGGQAPPTGLREVLDGDTVSPARVGI